MSLVGKETCSQAAMNANFSANISTLSVGPGCGGGSVGSTRAALDYGGYLSKGEYTYYLSIIEPIRFGLNIIVTPLLLLTVVSFSRAQGTNASNRFIVTINIQELAASVFNLVLSSLKYSVGPSHKMFVVWVIASNYGIVSCRRVVYALNLLLSAQRLFAVACPIKALHTGQNKSTIAVLLSLPICVFVYHVYLLVMYTVKEMQPNVFVMKSTEAYINNEALFDNLGHFSKTALSYVPLALTLVINLVLLGFLRHHSQKRKALTTNNKDSDRYKKDRQMTLMVLVSTLSYTVLSLPANANQMVSSIIDAYGTDRRQHYLFSVVKAAVNTSQTVGDLTNFVSYVCLSSSFRHHLVVNVWPGRRTTV